MSLSYEIDDWNTLFVEAFSGFLDGISICPACEESEDWGVRIDADPMFVESLVGQAMSEIYVPCDKHRGGTADLVVHDVAGLDWRWTGSTWASVINSYKSRRCRPPTLDPIVVLVTPLTALASAESLANSGTIVFRLRTGHDSENDHETSHRY